MGCLSRAGCLVVVVGAGAVGYWLYGDRLPSMLSRAASDAARTTVNSAAKAADRLSGNQVAPATEVRSDPASSDSAERTRATRDNATDTTPIAWASVRATVNSPSIASLAEADGPAFVTVGAGDLAALLSVPLKSQLPRSATDVQIALNERQLLVRGVVDVGEMAGDGTLGKLLGIALSGRDTLQMGGTIEPLRQGFAQYRIESLHVKGFDVPPRLIPSVLGVLRRSNTDSGLADNAFAIRLPRSVADLRIANGRMTLYKAEPPK